jgi:glycosyltransferase involved in cell wall biosynthesis
MSLSPRRIVILTELYYPEKTSTGKILGRLAAGIASHVPVSVICGQPRYDLAGQSLPRREVHEGVEVCRCGGTRFDKNRLLGRAINMVSLTVSIAWRLIFHLRRGDQVLVVTNPPLMPYFATLVCKLRRIPCHLLVHDMYPECLVATGMLSNNSILGRVTHALSRWLYRSMAGVITLGEDMRSLVAAKTGSDGPPVHVIANWADQNYFDVDRVAGPRFKERMGFAGKRLVVYAGNIGRTHDVDILVRAARLCDRSTDIHFVIAGSGAKRKSLEQQLAIQKVDNLTLLDRLSDADFLSLVAAADVNLITFIPGMRGISVPSRSYNAMAVGRPLIVAGDPTSEICQLIDHRGIGWSVPAGEAEQLADLLETVLADRAELDAAGRRARRLALDDYTFANILNRFVHVLDIAIEDGRCRMQVPIAA